MVAIGVNRVLVYRAISAIALVTLHMINDMHCFESLGPYQSRLQALNPLHRQRQGLVAVGSLICMGHFLAMMLVVVP